MTYNPHAPEGCGTCADPRPDKIIIADLKKQLDTANDVLNVVLKAHEALLKDYEEEADAADRYAECSYDRMLTILDLECELSTPWYVKLARWARRQWEYDIYEGD
jgi:hypothetical protein